MKRTHKNDKELKEVQCLKQENKKLRRQVRKLRKVISKIDIEQYEFIKDLMESQAKEDSLPARKAEKEQLEKKWECHNCEDGILRIFVFNRKDGCFYLRKCDVCGKRTKMQKFTDHVEGVK